MGKKSWTEKYRKVTNDKKFPDGKLGNGGNGTVYLVAAKSNKQQFALKELHSNKSKYAQIQANARFKNEIELMERYQELDSGILPVIEKNFEEYWYIMPLATPINNYLNEKNRDLVNIVKEIRSLASTLQFLHKKGISHRDIKPDNIFFYDGRYTLGDFGLATTLDGAINHTKVDRGLGAIFTIAPEMKRSPKGADGTKADVFSLAKTLWMLIYNEKRGFDGVYDTTDTTIGLRFISGKEKKHFVEIERLLKKATSNAPEDRPDMCGFIQFLDAWLKVSDDENRQFESQWKFLEETLFSGFVPNKASWTNVETIVSVLNNITSMPVLSHLLSPDGGGFDFKCAEKATEDDCIYIL